MDSWRAGAVGSGVDDLRRGENSGGYSFLSDHRHDYHRDGGIDAVCAAARECLLSDVGRAAASVDRDSFIDFSFYVFIRIKNLTCNFVHRKQDLEYETVSKTAAAQNFTQFRKHICRVVYGGIGSGLSEAQCAMGSEKLKIRNQK